MAENPSDVQKKPDRFDRNDVQFYAGLLLVGVGLTFAVSWAVALVVVGAVIAIIEVVNSYVLAILSR